jgi:hypothetical protein
MGAIRRLARPVVRNWGKENRGRFCHLPRLFEPVDRSCIPNSIFHYVGPSPSSLPPLCSGQARRWTRAPCAAGHVDAVNDRDALPLDDDSLLANIMCGPARNYTDCGQEVRDVSRWLPSQSGTCMGRSVRMFLRLFEDRVFS